MSNSPAEIFCSSESVEVFREKIISLNGDFFFDKDDMLDLGRAYFERFPDSYNHRNSDEVLIGYELARICIIEKTALDFDDTVKECLRIMIKDISGIDARVKNCVTRKGHETVKSISGAFLKNLNAIKFTIDGLPQGMIKERFIGGLTIFFNISYIINLSIEKHK